MIYLRELISIDIDNLPEDHFSNILQLHYRLNKIRHHWQVPMYITSGYRTEFDHRRIYKEKGIHNPPMGSKHLIGAAADVSDPKGSLKKWIGDNIKIVEKADLWMESFEATGGLDGGWVHFQLYPPSSGNRFFEP